MNNAKLIDDCVVLWRAFIGELHFPDALLAKYENAALQRIVYWNVFNTLFLYLTSLGIEPVLAMGIINTAQVRASIKEIEQRAE